MEAAPPSPLGVADLSDDERKNGLYLHKTLWAVSPDARSDITIQAKSVPGQRPVRFFDGQTTRRQLRFPRPRGVWSYATTTTLLPGAGCFEFQARSRGYDQRIRFEAVVR